MRTRAADLPVIQLPDEISMHISDLLRINVDLDEVIIEGSAHGNSLYNVWNFI